MDTMELEKLSENEMSYIKGGNGHWEIIDGRWIWVETYDLGDEDYNNM